MMGSHSHSPARTCTNTYTRRQAYLVFVGPRERNDGLVAVRLDPLKQGLQPLALLLHVMVLRG
jgi:hypothetical protein